MHCLFFPSVELIGVAHFLINEKQISALLVVFQTHMFALEVAAWGGGGLTQDAHRRPPTDSVCRRCKNLIA